jgi:hypothetical protein
MVLDSAVRKVKKRELSCNQIFIREIDGKWFESFEDKFFG